MDSNYFNGKKKRRRENTQHNSLMIGQICVFKNKTGIDFTEKIS